MIEVCSPIVNVCMNSKICIILLIGCGIILYQITIPMIGYGIWLKFRLLMHGI